MPRCRLVGPSLGAFLVRAGPLYCSQPWQHRVPTRVPVLALLAVRLIGLGMKVKPRIVRQRHLPRLTSELKWPWSSLPAHGSISAPSKIGRRGAPRSRQTWGMPAQKRKHCISIAWGHDPKIPQRRETSYVTFFEVTFATTEILNGIRLPRLRQIALAVFLGLLFVGGTWSNDCTKWNHMNVDRDSAGWC